MKKYSMFKCEECNNVFEYSVEGVRTSFPKTVQCPKCKCVHKNIFTNYTIESYTGLRIYNWF